MKPLTDIQYSLYAKINALILQHRYSDGDIIMALAKMLNDYKKINPEFNQRIKNKEEDDERRKNE